MSYHNSERRERTGSGGSLTEAAAQDTVSPIDHEGARGRLPGLPGTENDDCKPTYSGHGLSGIGSESSPSAGWRRVYIEMGLRTDG